MPGKKDKKRIKDLISKWRPKLFLGEWDIDLVFTNEEPNQGQAAECHCNPQYLHATIKIYPCFWKHSHDQQQMCIVHELCHLLTQRVWDLTFDLVNGKLSTPNEIQYHVEQLTQRIANVAVYGGKN